jgi:glycosyltransferase involved in cell wall biosynthesis
MKKISVAIATFNEESNISRCLKSVSEIADEIVIVDGTSTDKTVEIARSFGARVIEVPNDPMFHNMKQRSFDEAKGEWILYLDADEKVSKKLAQEIKKVISMNEEDLEKYQDSLSNKKLFLRHQHLLEKRDGKIGSNEGFYTAFFFPRLNYFLGKFLKYGGVYPDGVIRLFKKGSAYLPCKDVHEQMVVKGRVGWLESPLLHYDSPNFERYIKRNDRYINLIVEQFREERLKKNITNGFNYMILEPLNWFFMTLIRHKGILDGWQGVVFSFFSSIRFTRAYWRYMIGGDK